MNESAVPPSCEIAVDLVDGPAAKICHDPRPVAPEGSETDAEQWRFE